MNNNSNTSSGGIGFFGLLAIVFVVLKLIHKIDWSWWWVLSPLWLPTLVVMGAFIIGFVIYLLVKAVKR